MMVAFRTVSRRFLIVALALLAAGQASANFPWHKPIDRNPAEVQRIMGPQVQKEPSRDLNIVWVWSIDKSHEKETHEYGWVMDRFVFELLPKVPRVTATHAYNFPTTEQWENADLVVFYMWPHIRDWGGNWDYEDMDRFQKRGGGMMFFHMALQENSGIELAKRIGLAWQQPPKGSGGQVTAWGPLPPSASLTPEGLNHTIFERFPPRVTFHEETYWHLTGDPADVTTLMTTPAGPTIANKVPRVPPKLEDLDGKKWPVMWTAEVGKGKVFATTTGHNFFTFNDPYFRIIMLRAMAWTLNESFDPFKPLVTLETERW
jgi:hypothetical protein